VTTQITYEGKPLASRQRVWWRVRAWDKTGKESLWSAPASFEMGLLNEADWRDAQWIGCDRDYKAPHPAPAELMGAWIEPSADAAVTCFFKDIQLSNKPIVSAMAYWGQSKLAGPSAVVVNFEKLEGFELAPMTRIMRSRKYGFCDLAFYLEPGKINRVELRFAKPPKNVAITIGMRIVFADGEEMTLKSGDDWQVQQDGKGKAVAAVKVVEPYGGAKYGKAMAFNQTNLPPAYFRKKIEVRSGLREGRLYLCALGQGQTYVNGVAADESLLSPPQSDYEEQAFYTTQDITGLLKPGVNALAVLLDGGWYHEVGGFGTVFSYGRPGLRALVALDYSDGKTEWIASGPDWQWKEGAIRLANIYLGERVDYRRDHDEWKSPDAGDGWKTAQVIPPCTPKLLPMDVVPVRRCGEIKPLKQWQLGSKTWRFDVGEMIHGWVKFTVKEPTGTTVRLRYVEHTKDGVMENIPVSHWWCHGVTQGDEIVCDGKPHVFETIFTPKSFRFVEISGVSGPPDDLVAVLVHTAAPALATFESSDPMLNRLFQNGMRTFRNYMNHMFGDIPRERCLWGAESIYSAIPATYCYDWAPNHRLMNLLWCTGAMTREGIPGDIGLGKRITTSTSSFIWSVTPLYLSSKMFEHYGDLDPGNRFYDKLRHLLRHTEKTGKKGGTIPIPNQLSDHAPVKDVPRNPANGELINTLVFFDAQNRFARMADALGKTDDAAHARDHAEKIRATVMGFYDGRKHTFGNGTHDSLALAYGVITDPTEQKALAASLVGYYRANGHQFDGGFMSYEIYPQLSRFGYADDAVKMLVNTKPPGPARSVKVYDATSFWEAYYLDHDYQMFRGLNFMATAHPIGWMLTDLAGIRFNADRLVLAPAVPRTEKLDWVKASVKTMHGTVESAWKLEGEKFTWNFTIPANVTAEICIPGEAAYEVNAGSYSINRRMARKSPVPVTATVKQSASSDGKEWKVSPGCAVQFADGSMIVTPGQGATQMLTTALPSFVGGKTTVRFRLKTVATEGGIVRLVSMNKGEKNARTMEFKLGPAGAWQEYTVAVPEFEGKPFSLWIGLAREKETLAFDEIAFVNANGNTLKQWSF
jgi:alpha-L-rhamnosidase